MPRIVTSRKRQRPQAPSAGARDRAIRAASIAVVAICAAFAAWRLLAPAAPSPAPGDAPAPSRARTRGDIPGATAPDIASPAPSAAGDTPRKGAPSRVATDNTQNAQSSGRSAPRDAQATTGSADQPATMQSDQPRAREFFDNEVENTIASVSEPGAEFFGFPPGIDMEDDEIIEFLRRPVEISEEDDEDTIAAKERTAEFKAKALKAIEEDGLTFNQFVRDLVALRNEQAAMREEAYQEMVKIIRRDGEAAAREYLNSVNPELKAQGMKEIVISPFLLEEE